MWVGVDEGGRAYRVRWEVILRLIELCGLGTRKLKHKVTTSKYVPQLGEWVSNFLKFTGVCSLLGGLLDSRKCPLFSFSAGESTRLATFRGTLGDWSCNGAFFAREI